ncbi:glycosyltransferase family 2 protein [Pelagovum pacificum]|uniref:glycosyltransferase family 2 protein n=1 Tax=Pelagovum pacificum TaxID=2588711 RepID=UPI0018CD9D5D|nr:glycosyltransferase [Pelagovum pacificum]QQA42854.1 glycosyltransferase [Pelagovum pacificum]
MTDLTVSVVVVSRGRPDALARCIAGIVRLHYPSFEIVVVADRPGRRKLDTLPDVFNRIKIVACDEANISVARNLGIAHAAGEIVAFIDDDAVPEPLWLDHLVQGFGDPRVEAATGYVIGPDGINFQHRITEARPDGTGRPIRTDGKTIRLLQPSEDGAIKTEGTNMAFRRDTLLELGGFDPVFRFYLDETDLDMRVALAGGITAAAPLAQVHHAMAGSAQRRDDRVPSSLTDVGRSLAVFVRRYLSDGEWARAGRAERQRRRKSLISHMVAGRIEPRDVRRILSTFDAGWSEGSKLEPDPIPLLRSEDAEFLGFRASVRQPGHRIVAGRTWQSREKHADALRLAEQGWTVTLFLISPTSRPHHAAYANKMYWCQRGGLFGRSTRQEPHRRSWRFDARIRAEQLRLSPVRGSPPAEVDKH